MPLICQNHSEGRKKSTWFKSKSNHSWRWKRTELTEILRSPLMRRKFSFTCVDFFPTLHPAVAWTRSSWSFSTVNRFLGQVAPQYANHPSTCWSRCEGKSTWRSDIVLWERSIRHGRFTANWCRAKYCYYDSKRRPWAAGCCMWVRGCRLCLETRVDGLRKYMEAVHESVLRLR